MKKFAKVVCIGSVVLLFWVAIYYVIFKLIWQFDVLSIRSYKKIHAYWNQGGVFRTFKDCSLLFFMSMFPILCIYYTRKVYKRGFWKTILSPFIKIYRKFTAPEPMDDVHIVIKNLGVKSGSLDEMLADRIKKDGGLSGNKTLISDIRQQISVKIEEICLYIFHLF